MLPVLAILNLVCAWQVSRLAPAPTSRSQSREFSAELTPEPAWSGVRVLAETPYLRHLALLVLLGTTSAALIDYVFKAQAVATLGTGESLLRFFAVYYAGRQPRHRSPCRPRLSRLVAREVRARVYERDAVHRAVRRQARRAGRAGTRRRDCRARRGIGVPRLAVPRRATRCSTRPIPAAEKRAAKSIIDVGFDRIGDAVGGGAIRFILAACAGSAAVGDHRSRRCVCSAAAALVASRLNRGYVQTLERNLREHARRDGSLRHRGPDHPDDDAQHACGDRALVPARLERSEPCRLPSGKSTNTTASGLDPEIQDILPASIARSRSRPRACFGGTKN